MDYWGYPLEAGGPFGTSEALWGTSRTLCTGHLVFELRPSKYLQRLLEPLRHIREKFEEQIRCFGGLLWTFNKYSTVPNNHSAPNNRVGVFFLRNYCTMLALFQIGKRFVSKPFPGQNLDQYLPKCGFQKLIFGQK